MKIQNGALYMNINKERVERVVGKLNENRVFTVSHGYSDFGPVKRSALRKATPEEVTNYFGESHRVKSQKRMQERIDGVKQALYPTPVGT